MIYKSEILIFSRLVKKCWIIAPASYGTCYIVCFASSDILVYGTYSSIILIVPSVPNWSSITEENEIIVV